MKKLAILVLMSVTPVFADIAVTPGSGKTVHSDTVNGLEYQDIKIIDGTTGGTSSMTVTATGAAKVDGSAVTQPISWTGAGAQPVTSTSTVITSTYSVNTNITGGSISNTGFNVNNTPAVTQSGTWTVQPGNTQNTTPWQTISTSTVITSTYSINTNITGGSIANTGFNVNNTPAVTQSGTWTTQLGNTQNITPIQVISTATVVTSTYSINTAITNTPTVNAAQSGTWTVQPGNTQNTVPHQVISTYTVVTSTYALNWTGVAAYTPPAITTVSWTLPGAQPVTSTSTVVTSTAPLNVNLTNGATVQGLLSSNGATATTNRIGTLPAITQNAPANNGSAFTQGRDAALNILTNSGATSVASYPDSTYNCYSVGITSATTYANTTDIACLIGNGTNKVIAPYFVVTATQTTAGLIPVSVIKRSSLDVTSSVSSMTATALSSSYGVAVSSVVLFTASPTLGTQVGSPLHPELIGAMATATATANDIYMSPSWWRMNGPQLRSATEELCVSLTTTTVTGGNLRIGVNWCEVTAP